MSAFWSLELTILEYCSLSIWHRKLPAVMLGVFFNLQNYWCLNAFFERDFFSNVFENYEHSSAIILAFALPNGFTDKPATGYSNRCTPLRQNNHKNKFRYCWKIQSERWRCQNGEKVSYPKLSIHKLNSITWSENLKEIHSNSTRLRTRVFLQSCNRKSMHVQTYTDS